jgi:hypothetical protein
MRPLLSPTRDRGHRSEGFLDLAGDLPGDRKNTWSRTREVAIPSLFAVSFDEIA